MTLAIHAVFETEISAKGPKHIGLQGLLAEKSLSGLLARKKPSHDQKHEVVTPKPARIKASELVKRKKTYPVENYFLNGAQYLTGGVGNRLAFSSP